MNALVITDLPQRLAVGMLLDRAQTKALLIKLEGLASSVAGSTIMQAQLRAVLSQKDWLRISIVADPATARTFGVNIGIAEVKPTTRPKPQPKPHLSPMQKWQRRNGLDRRVL